MNAGVFWALTILTRTKLWILWGKWLIIVFFRSSIGWQDWKSLATLLRFKIILHPPFSDGIFFWYSVIRHYILIIVVPLERLKPFFLLTVWFFKSIIMWMMYSWTTRMVSMIMQQISAMDASPMNSDELPFFTFRLISWKCHSMKILLMQSMQSRPHAMLLMRYAVQNLNVQVQFLQAPASSSFHLNLRGVSALSVIQVGCYKEIYRVLKPGQYFAAYEWCMTESFDPRNENHQKIKAEIELGNGLPDIRSTAQCLDALKRAGFEVISPPCFLNWQTWSSGLKWRTGWWYFWFSEGYLGEGSCNGLTCSLVPSPGYQPVLPY